MPARVNEDKSTRYHRLRRRADLAGTMLAGVVLLLLAVSGAGVRLREGFQAVAGAVLPAGLDEPATVVLVTVAVFAILQVVEFPFAWYHGFALEHRYGLSTQKGAHWLARLREVGADDSERRSSRARSGSGEAGRTVRSTNATVAGASGGPIAAGPDG